MVHLWCSEEPHFVHNRAQVGFPYACQAGSASSQASRSARRMRMVVLPAMRAFSRPLRTWARMILAGTPVRASASGTPSRGAFGDGDVGLLLGVVRFGRGCVLLLCHDDVYASRDSAPQRVRGVLHRHGCGAWIGNGVLDRFLEDESLFGEFLRTPVSEGGVEPLVVGPPHIVVEVGA